MRNFYLVTLALAFTLGYLSIIYGFFVWIWPILPPFAKLICFIFLAVFAIGSPIFGLISIGKHRTKQRAQDNQKSR